MGLLVIECSFGTGEGYINLSPQQCLVSLIPRGVGDEPEMDGAVECLHVVGKLPEQSLGFSCSIIGIAEWGVIVAEADAYGVVLPDPFALLVAETEEEAIFREIIIVEFLAVIGTVGMNLCHGLVKFLLQVGTLGVDGKMYVAGTEVGEEAEGMSVDVVFIVKGHPGVNLARFQFVEILLRVKRTFLNFSLYMMFCQPVL